MIRYGSSVAFVDYRESLTELLHRLQHVGQAKFLAERHTLDVSWLREQKHWVSGTSGPCYCRTWKADGKRR